MFLVAFAVFFGLSACWSLATPMFASPDETSHLVKAAATVRGEISGKPGFVEQWMNDGKAQEPMRSYRVPVAYGAAVFPCFAFDVKLTPACEKKQKQPTSRTGSVTQWTTAGHYNPIYYVLVGWPSLAFKGVNGMFLIRLASALLDSVLLAGAMTIAAACRRPGFVVAGLVTAVTPMVFFLDGMVNPTSLEASSAVLAWVTALSLALQPEPDQLRKRVITLLVAATLLVNVRPLGYEWLTVILAVSLCVASKTAVRAVLSCRTTWRALMLATPALLFGLWWTLDNGDDAKVPYRPIDAFIPAAHFTLNMMQGHIQAMIALFGWMNTWAPMVTYDLWIGAAILLALTALALGGRRRGAAVFVMALGVVLVPVLAQGIQAKHIGLIWQGRYLLAFAVGLPILAGAVLAAKVQEARLPSWVDRRMILVLSAALAVANFAAFFRSLRRNMVGLNGRLLLEPITWQPPGTWLLWVPLYAVLLSMYVALAVRSASAVQTMLPDRAAVSVRAITRPRSSASAESHLT